MSRGPGPLSAVISVVMLPIMRPTTHSSVAPASLPLAQMSLIAVCGLSCVRVIDLT